MLTSDLISDRFSGFSGFSGFPQRNPKFRLDATVLADLSKPRAAPGALHDTGATLPERAPVAGSYPQQWTANGMAISDLF